MRSIEWQSEQSKTFKVVPLEWSVPFFRRFIAFWSVFWTKATCLPIMAVPPGFILNLLVTSTPAPSSLDPRPLDHPFNVGFMSIRFDPKPWLNTMDANQHWQNRRIWFATSSEMSRQ